eukprot:526633_1
MNYQLLLYITCMISCLILIYSVMSGPQRQQLIPDTPITIPPTQYAPINHQQYLHPLYSPLYSPYPSAYDLSILSRDPRYSDPNNNAYISPVPARPNNNAYIVPARPIASVYVQPQDTSNAHSNNRNDQIENLIRLRPRPGNPRLPQQYINTYGICRSDEQPSFTDEFFDWSVYGIDSNTDEYVSIFKCLGNKNKIIDVKTNLEISDGTIKKCSMSSRAKTIKTIEDSCTDVIWWQQDKCPFSPSSAQQPEDSTEDVIASALNAGLNPNSFRLKHPKIASVKSNMVWYTNSYDGQQKEKRKNEQKEAVQWFEPMINPIQTAVVQLIERDRAAYCRRYDTDAKKILMGNRNINVVCSPDGNRGLSTSGKYMKFKHGEEKVICISGGGKSDDVITNFHTQLKVATHCEYLIWNVPRESSHLWSWSSLEQMCDAMTSTNKYNSITKMVSPPSSLVITNKMFELRNPATKMPLITLDRIKMYRVMSTSDTVQAVDVYEYYQAKYGEDPRAMLNNRQEIDLKDL